MNIEATRQVIDILARRDRAAAVNQTQFLAGDIDLLPEAMVLFATPGLNISQQWQMAQDIFRPTVPFSGRDVARLADCAARIGRYGFSFPQWRHITQSYKGTSLIEQFGMHRLRRATDQFDPALPDPARDRLGAGFADKEGGVYIEYRRAYILCSCQTPGRVATLVIRNNSDYYGRDRLPDAVYLSFQPLLSHPSQIDEAILTSSGFFQKWQDIFADKYVLARSNKLDRVAMLLDRLDAFDKNLSLWLFDEGIGNLSAFLRDRLAQGAKPPYLAAIDPALPPWFPEQAIPATKETISQLGRIQPSMPAGPLAPLFSQARNSRLVLLTGKDGDLPFKPPALSRFPVAQMPVRG